MLQNTHSFIRSSYVLFGFQVPPAVQVGTPTPQGGFKKRVIAGNSIL